MQATIKVFNPYHNAWLDLADYASETDLLKAMGEVHLFPYEYKTHGVIDPPHRYALINHVWHIWRQALLAKKDGLLKAFLVFVKSTSATEYSTFCEAYRGLCNYPDLFDDDYFNGEFILIDGFLFRNM